MVIAIAVDGAARAAVHAHLEARATTLHGRFKEAMPLRPLRSRAADWYGILLRQQVTPMQKSNDLRVNLGKSPAMATPDLNCGHAGHQ
jgi:hypothetical protein